MYSLDASVDRAGEAENTVVGCDFGHWGNLGDSIPEERGVFKASLQRRFQMGNFGRAPAEHDCWSDFGTGAGVQGANS